MTGSAYPSRARIHCHAPATQKNWSLPLPQFAGTTKETLNLSVLSFFEYSCFQMC